MSSTTTSKVLSRDEFLDSIDMITIESDSEIEEVHTKTCRKRYKLTLEDLDKDVESISDDDVQLEEQAEEKCSKKRFTKKRKVKEAVIVKQCKVNNNNKRKNHTRRSKKQVADIRQSSVGSSQRNWSSQSLTNESLPYGWKMCFERKEMEGRIVMVAAYKDPAGQVYTRGDNGFSQDVLKHFKLCSGTHL